MLEVTDPTNRFIKAIPVMCDTCQEADDAAQAERNRTEQLRVYGERVKASGMPERLLAMTFETLRATPENAVAQRLAKQWSRGAFPGLLVQGPVGTGKTVTSAAAANEFMKRRPLRWFSVSRMLAQARAGFSHPGKDEVTTVLLNPKLPLLLDDIDKTTPTAFARDILYQAIDERVNNGTPLLVTTNFHYDELEDAYKEPIASRLAGYCKVVRLDGIDQRKAGRP